MEDPAVSRGMNYRFSPVEPTAAQISCREALNDAVTGLVRRLPASTQTEGMLFLINYTGNTLGEPLDFFRKFYSPSWTLLYWIARKYCEDADELSHRNASVIPLHAMAMLLHALDDHLCDGALPVSHLCLLLRSEAWRLMNEVCAAHEDEHTLLQGMSADCIDRYYRAVTGGSIPAGLEDYCTRFRDQMATWFVAPALLLGCCGRSGKEIDAVLSAYGSFGLAWRLLDDIQDFKEDAVVGAQSAVYHALSAKGKKLWAGSAPDKLHDVLNREGTLERLWDRITGELSSAAGDFDTLGLEGYGAELRSLTRPPEGPPAAVS